MKLFCKGIKIGKNKILTLKYCEPTSRPLFIKVGQKLISLKQYKTFETKSNTIGLIENNLQLLQADGIYGPSACLPSQGSITQWTSL